MKIKNLLSIAMLLLGVVACSDKNDDVHPEKIVSTKYMKPGPPPDSKPRNYCRTCGGTSNVLRCTVRMTGGMACESPFISPHDEEYEYPLYKFPFDYINAGNGALPDLDTNSAGEFMKNYLFAFDKGDQYINHLEWIGLAMHDNGGIPLLDIPAHYNFAMDTYEVADSLRNGQPSCVPVTTAYKSDALAMISYWRVRCSRPEFQAALDSITADLNVVTGLTRAQLYSMY